MRGGVIKSFITSTIFHISEQIRCHCVAKTFSFHVICYFIWYWYICTLHQNVFKIVLDMPKIRIDQLRENWLPNHQYLSDFIETWFKMKLHVSYIWNKYETRKKILLKYICIQLNWIDVLSKNAIETTRVPNFKCAWHEGAKKDFWQTCRFTL